jgi:hypothetical protein
MIQFIGPKFGEMARNLILYVLHATTSSQTAPVVACSRCG